MRNFGHSNGTLSLGKNALQWQGGNSCSIKTRFDRPVLLKYFMLSESMDRFFCSSGHAGGKVRVLWLKGASDKKRNQID